VFVFAGEAVFFFERFDWCESKVGGFVASKEAEKDSWENCKSEREQGGDEEQL
jgi:hypothetical protein